MKYIKMVLFAIFITVFIPGICNASEVVPDVTGAPPSAEPVYVSEPVTQGALSLDTTSIKLGIGQEYNLKLNEACDSVTYTSSNENVATVTKEGLVHALKKGKTVITAESGGKTVSCRVKVSYTGLSYSSCTIYKGEVLRLHLLDAKGKVRWRSDNKKVAVVKKGMVTGIKKGKATISAVTEDAVYSVCVTVDKAKKSIIYLTFDDGPSLTSTPRILNILKKNNVKATFFTVNYNADGEKLIKREKKEGHTVAIHGYSHDYGKIYRSEKAYMDNLYNQQNKLYKTLGYKVWITRFPGGSSNLVSRSYSRGIMTKLVKKVDKAGFSYFDWNVSSSDAGGATNSGQVYRSVISGLRKNRENVVLMHDFSGNYKTIGALDRIIKYGKSHGYEFRAITDSTTAVHHGVQN